MSVNASPQVIQALQDSGWCNAPSGNVRASEVVGQQNLRAFHHPAMQYPYLMSNSHCSLLTIKKAATAVRNPTMVTMIQPIRRSPAIRIRPPTDLRRRRRYKRVESLIASCSQSMEEKEEYQTRIPFTRTTPSVSRSGSPGRPSKAGKDAS